MENETPRFDRSGALRNVDNEREGTADLNGGHDTNRNDEPNIMQPTSSNGVRRTPIFDVPGTATSSGSSFSSTLTLPRSATSGKGRDAIINEYYNETSLVTVIETWIKQLIHKQELPYNPYPDLVWQARRCAERFHMFGEDSRTVLEKIESQVFSVGSDASRTQDSPARWGIATILHVVNTEALTQFDWLLLSMNSDVSTDDSQDYSVSYFTKTRFVILKSLSYRNPFQFCLALCVFVGTLYPITSEESIDIRMEYAISGPEKNHAAEIFAKTVLSDIQMMNDTEVHIVLGVAVPVEDVRRRGHWAKEFWTCHNIEEIQDQFLTLLKSAAAAQKVVEAQCMFRLQPERRLYRRGRKQYNLNFISTEGERSTSVSSHPFLSAHEGVFVSGLHIKEYLSWFARLEQAHQQSLVTPATTARTQSLRTGRSRRNRDTSNIQLQSSAVTRTTSQAGSSTTSQGDRNNYYPVGAGPYSEESLSAIKTYFSDKIFELGDQIDFFRMLHYVILVVLLNREDPDAQECLVEAYKLMKSTAYQLHLIMQQNHVLQDLVTFFSSCGMGASDIAQTHFLAYRHSLKDFFSNSLREKSRDLLCYGKVLLNMLDAMTVVTPHLEGKTRTGTLPLTTEVNRGLEVINRYCETVFFGLIDDALSCCSFLVKYFPPVKNRNSLTVQQSFKHGAERADIINQGKLVLFVAEQAKTVAAPSAITKETVLLKYLVDSRLDQVFHEFLVDLVTDEEFIPPNPYPRLTSALSVAAMRMELFGEKHAKLLSKLVSGSVQLIDAENFVCHVPGIEAYGLVSAVAALDGKQYNYLRGRLHSLANKVNTRMTVAGFSTTVDMALGGFGPIYGHMTPYLHEIDLEEHYFVQGPSHSRRDAIMHFAKLVYEHLVDFSEKEDGLFLGFFLGGESLRRSLRDIIPPQRKKAFMSQLVSTVMSKQPLYLRVYVKLDWRLVMVKKSFCLHFLHAQENGYERFYASSDPVAFYQIVFSKQDAASLYTRCCGPQHHTDPCKGENLVLSLVHMDHYIERAKEEEDLLSVYRLLMVKSLMSQHKSYLVEAWRMLHSVASQLEYLCTLNKTLQSLVNEELSRAFRPVLDGDERTSLLDASALSTMVTAYSDKLERVLSCGTAMTPSGLLPRLRDKVRQVTSTDPVSRSLSLLISSKTPIILQEINEMLQPLMDAAAHNVHLACPEIHRALKSVEVDVSGRKSSMLSK
ncbi:hypothetical protein OS493_004178 [Desmophyllum pertusum]|uniref:Uncharacterized protein n=1 Tax=Desmophyllum pertusum TaxID=174260 RepID=A0A9X0D692_9CNID|nr:hypothetical protein OS493_004178 [Desmophyllum pertusum]